MAGKKKSKKKAATKKSSYSKPTGDGTMGFHVVEKERAKINAKAKRFADGNVSAWIRHAAMNYDQPLSD